MGDEHIGTREEAIARLHAEQAAHEDTRQALRAAIERAEHVANAYEVLRQNTEEALLIRDVQTQRLRDCLPSAREFYAITRVADQWIPSHAREKDEKPVRAFLARLQAQSDAGALGTKITPPEDATAAVLLATAAQREDKLHATLSARDAKIAHIEHELADARRLWHAWRDRGGRAEAEVARLTKVLADMDRELATTSRELVEARQEREARPDIIGECVDEAVIAFGGEHNDGVFNAAGFAVAFARRVGLRTPPDGIAVRGILSGRPDVTFLTPGDAHYQRTRDFERHRKDMARLPKWPQGFPTQVPRTCPTCHGAKYATVPWTGVMMGGWCADCRGAGIVRGSDAY